MTRFARLIFLLLSAVVLTIAVFPQGKSDGKTPPRQGPRLIRDDQTMAPPEKEEKFELDPVKAQKSYKIGLFYLKGDHLDAALMRFREAVKYKPDFAEAKWMFIETLHKKKDWKNVLEFTSQYIKDETMKGYRDKLRKYHDIAQKNISRQMADPEK